MTPISAVIITLNNERTIEQTLKSLHWVNEIVVVDSGSKDKTLEICENYSCKIIHHEFEGFGKQKHFAVDEAKNDWVLVIDSDEVCVPEFIEEVKNKVGNEDVLAYKIPISLIFLGKVLKFGGEYKKMHLRLFNKKHGQYNLNEVHEDVILNTDKVSSINNHLLHDSYENMHQYFEKFNIYTTKAANQLYKDNKKANILLSPFKFFFNFIKLYLVKGLLLDGKAGLIWAFLSSFYSVVKYYKLYDMYQLDSKK
ncbi:MAG: glycosyltransferase family 2 protein [Bacteroidetes bacterium]|nr:glycosyltransferase family 2 protein [Bacteroidota bacterium]